MGLSFPRNFHDLAANSPTLSPAPDNFSAPYYGAASRMRSGAGNDPTASFLLGQNDRLSRYNWSRRVSLSSYLPIIFLFPFSEMLQTETPCKKPIPAASGAPAQPRKRLSRAAESEGAPGLCCRRLLFAPVRWAIFPRKLSVWVVLAELWHPHLHLTRSIRSKPFAQG